MQVSVMCGGVSVRPGDVVVGDDNGVVVGPPETLATLLPMAQKIHETETAVREGLLAGKGLESLTNFQEHLEKRLAKEESVLEFRV